MTLRELYLKFLTDPHYGLARPEGADPFWFTYKDKSGELKIGCRQSVRSFKLYPELYPEFETTLDLEVVDEFITPEQVKALKSCQNKTT